MVDGEEVLAADALEQGVGVFVGRGPQINAGTIVMGEKVGGAQICDKAQREGGVRVVDRRSLLAESTRSKEQRRLVREQGQVSKVLEVLLEDHVAELRRELEEFCELDFVVRLFEEGDQSFLPDAVFGDVDVAGAEALSELLD